MTAKNTNITVELPSGAKVTGKIGEVRDILVSLGYDSARYLKTADVYYSDSRGEYVRLVDMNTMHLRNAILKLYSEWIETLRKLDNKKLIRAISSGLPDEILPMLNELATRKD